MTQEAYPHFSQEVSPEELMACYTLDNTDWQLLHQARGVPNRFGLAVLLKTFQHLGYFVERLSEVPPGIIAHLAQQLLLLPHVLNAYDDTHPVKRHRHRAWIRRHVGTHAYRPQQHEPRLRQVLLDGPAQEAQFPHALLPAAVAQLRAWKIELPARQSLLRLLASVLEEADRTLFRTLAARLSDQQKQQLDGFLQAEQPHTQSPFHRVKQSPGRPSVATLHEEAQKLQQLRAFGMEPQVLAGISPRKAAYLANLVDRYTNTDMARFAADKRYALLAAFIVDRCITITDQIVDVFLTLMRKLSSKSEEQLGREIVREVKEGQDHHELLYELSILLLAHPQGIVDEVVFSRIPKAQLEDVVQTKGKRRRSYRLRHYDVMSQKFAHHYGRALSLVLQHLRFQTSSSHQWLLRAIAAVTGHLGSRKWYLDEETPMGDMSESWQRCVLKDTPEGRRLVRRFYELWVAQQLERGLKNGDVWVEGSRDYQNWDGVLPQDWLPRRGYYLQSHQLPLRPSDFVELWHERTHQNLRALSDTLPTDPDVDFRSGKIQLARPEALERPEEVDALRETIFTKAGQVSLIDILVDVDHLIGFTDDFSHLAGREQRDRDTLRRYLLATLFAYGTNIGPSKMAMAAGMDSRQLMYVKKWYLYEEALKQANIKVVNQLHALKASHLWGDGTACASDGRMFPTYDHNLFARWYNRYGGQVILVYWHVADQYVSIYSQVAHPSASQALLMLEGLLQHDTEMAVAKDFVDSHGQSEVAFAFSTLLGFKLLPRLKRLKEERLYRPALGAIYPNLEPVMTRPINWRLIAEQYETMAQLTVAIAEHGASPSAILRRFNTYARRNSTYRGIVEFGKVVKTNFLCEYLRLPDLRREIHAGLNKVEAWNGLTTFICYGKAGEVTERQLSDQVQSIACLQLLQNCLIFWNTLVMDRLLANRADVMQDADQLRRLSPLLHHHVNPYGTFEIDLRGSGVLEGPW